MREVLLFSFAMLPIPSVATFNIISWEGTSLQSNGSWRVFTLSRVLTVKLQRVTQCNTLKREERSSDDHSIRLVLVCICSRKKIPSGGLSTHLDCSGIKVTSSPFSTADLKFSSTSNSISFCVSHVAVPM